jgi:hypothetical protein
MPDMVSALRKATRNAHVWLPGYLKARAESRRAPAKRAWLAIADHYEPGWGHADWETQQRRVRAWVDRWPAIAESHRDSRGNPAQYSFFFPEDQYHPALLDSLRPMVERGIGDVEVHIHHGGEGEQRFVERMTRFLDDLENRHGLLRRHNGRRMFGFIHGNWCLDNADPSGRFCGLNNEITLLRDLGCYADFTLPCPHTTSQAHMVNTIYWATDDPQRPKSHDRGIPVRPGDPVRGDLMIVPGPIGINWKESRRVWMPKIEVGELAGNHGPSLHRARLWLANAPRIGGDVFIKLYAHGAPEKNAIPMLNGGFLAGTFDCMARVCAESDVDLQFVTTWQMWNAIEALRKGQDAVAAGTRPPQPVWEGR